MKQKILLVEDNSDNRLLFRYILDHAGFDVTAVETAEEANKALEQLIPDIIISDIALPGQNGNVFIKSLRKKENLKNLCAIAVSAYAREDDKLRTIESGYDAFIEKPIRAELFAEQIVDIYKNKQKALLNC